jgi:hypothetical protein
MLLKVNFYFVAVRPIILLEEGNRMAWGGRRTDNLKEGDR